MIELDPRAIEYFDEKARAMLLLLKPAPEEKRSKEIETASSHAFIETITEKEIINMNLGTVNRFGRQTSRFFIHNNKAIGLRECDYQQFDELIENLYKRKEINRLLSKTYIENILFNWFEKKYKGELGDSITFLSYLKDESEKRIKETKVSIPISFLDIQKPFMIGNVRFEYFTKDFFDEFIKEISEKAKQQPNYNEIQFNEGYRDMRRKYQGKVFSSIAVNAEEEKCLEIAMQETEKSLTILRFFSPAVFVPEVPSYFGRMGHTELPQDYVFIFHNTFPKITENIAEIREFIWTITEDQLNQLKILGLEVASKLIAQTEYSDFEKLLINSISLFARAITSNTFNDKLVFSLVSIETLLLKNSQEPIQNNVGQRISFLTSQELKDRKNIMKEIQKAYDLRSSYVHHGETKEDYMLLQKIQHLVWVALRNVLFMKDKFKSQKDLIDYIEDLILS